MKFRRAEANHRPAELPPLVVFSIPAGVPASVCVFPTGTHRLGIIIILATSENDLPRNVSPEVPVLRGSVTAQEQKRTTEGWRNSRIKKNNKSGSDGVRTRRQNETRRISTEYELRIMGGGLEMYRLIILWSHETQNSCV